MNDLVYPLMIVNGDIASIDSEVDNTSQVINYCNTRQNESILLPEFGRVTDPMISSRSAELLAEMERLNASVYFANIQFSGYYRDHVFYLNVQNSF